jgi:hypothetical protein
MEVTMNRRSMLAFGLGLMVVAGGCDILNPARPTPHDDTTLFGNLLSLTRVEGEEAAWLARVRVGLPREFSRAKAAEGKPTPTMEDGIAADVTVTWNTVVLTDGEPGFIEELNPGAEVVVIPVAGSTKMVGTATVTVEAAYFIDFATYRDWQLPELDMTSAEREPADDPARINSTGIEHAPLPIAGGRVLYFAARLRPPVAAGGRWSGARRDGMPELATDAPAVERPYRTALTDDGWTRPEPVSFPGLDEALALRVSWIDSSESRCLVTVEEAEGGTWVGAAERRPGSSGWSQVVKLDELGSESPADGTYLAGSRTKIVYSVHRAGARQTDLLLFDSNDSASPIPLDPSINSPASEWGPRVGPNNELFFNRNDLPLVLVGGTVRPVNPPGFHRVLASQPAPTDDGNWVFLCMPRFRPVELDQDIFVARWLGEGRLGKPVAVDDWRP